MSRFTRFTLKNRENIENVMVMKKLIIFLLLLTVNLIYSEAQNTLDSDFIIFSEETNEGLKIKSLDVN
ncbi:MAG TPA: hypothetical protein DCX95_01045, partial [Elusimicrobia bacterium]|nr:hypothetical protein [Elusimicrobiota bacterium]